MKALILYDSVFGNTEQIARAIAGAFPPADVALVKIDQANARQIADADLLVVGSPTRGFRPTPALADFLKALPAGSLKGKQVAAFDTRIDSADLSSPVFRFAVNLGGYAAKVLAGLLARKGGRLILPPQGFFVKDREGPLKPGELERAAAWLKSSSLLSQF